MRLSDSRKAKPGNGVHPRMVNYTPTERVGEPEKLVSPTSARRLNSSRDDRLVWSHHPRGLNTGRRSLSVIAGFSSMARSAEAGTTVVDSRYGNRGGWSGEGIRAGTDARTRNFSYGIRRTCDTLLQVIEEDDDMSVYMVDRDLPGIAMEDLAAAQQRAISTAAAFQGQGKQVSYIRSVFVPGDSHCMCLFAAANADLVAELNDVAEIPYTRITEALDLTP